MEKEFVSYEQAVALKELGFDEECLAWHNSTRLFIDNYDNYNSKMPFDYCCSTPLKQQVFRWFRDKYDLCGLVHRLEHMEEYYYMWVIDGVGYSSDWQTYEEAESACIDKLIELTKTK